MNTEYKEVNKLFYYILCMKNGIYYTLNFMRFYIDRDANVNVIYNAYQFDASRTFYTNQIILDIRQDTQNTDQKK